MFRIMKLSFKTILIQIGPVVSQIGRVHMDVALIRD
jgi:hypothetical protein